MKPINVGLLGIGTVGGGTFTVLARNAEEITRRAGRPIRITVVADKNVELANKVTKGACRVTDDAFSVVSDPEMYPIEDDQSFILEMLETEKVLVVQGSGFNWPHPDHFRVVFLPNMDDLTEAMGRIARFLEYYRKRYGK